MNQNPFPYRSSPPATDASSAETDREGPEHVLDAPIVSFLQFYIKESQMEPFERFLDRLTRQAREAPGCLWAFSFRAEDLSPNYIVLSGWTDNINIQEFEEAPRHVRAALTPHDCPSSSACTPPLSRGAPPSFCRPNLVQSPSAASPRLATAMRQGLTDTLIPPAARPFAATRRA